MFLAIVGPIRVHCLEWQNWAQSSLCIRYEDEINKRNAAENEFVVLKKVSGVAGSGDRWSFGCQGWADLERVESPGG